MPKTKAAARAQRSPAEILTEIKLFLEQDKDAASTSYQALKKAAAAIDPSMFNMQADLAAQRRALSELNNAVSIYLSKHRGPRGSQSGRNRKSAAEKLRTLTSPFLEKAVQDEKNAKQQEEQAILAPSMNQTQEKTLKKLAELHRNAGTARFVPQRSEFRAKPSLMKRAWGGIKYGLNSFFMTIGTFTTGAIPFIAARTTHTYGKLEKKIKEGYDTNLIPGTRNQHFEEPDLDKGGENQPILSDKRRIPIVYEKPIPEDPYQPPTMSLEFEQPVEGDSTAHHTTTEDHMGHAFITLKYSKKDPITGKMTRYRNSFGFYPKGGFSTNSITIGQLTSGFKIPGQLHEDTGHTASTGKTFTVNNQTINKVLLAAQNYEKDGYNFVRRNCTTFVADMAEVAKLDVKDLLQKDDIDGWGMKLKMGFVPFTGHTFSAAARRQVLERSKNADLSYQRGGRPMVNLDDVKHLDKHAMNIRMRGYIPSRGAEAVRADQDFSLHSMKYVTKMDDKDLLAERPAEYYIRASLAEVTLLKTAAENFARKVGEDMQDQIKELEAFLNNSLDLISGYADLAFANHQDKYSMYSEASPQEKQKALRDCTEAINECISGLDSIYKDTFKGDIRMNIPFQHMVSDLEHLRNECYNRETGIIDEYARENAFGNQSDFFRDEVGTSRTGCDALIQYKFGLIDVHDTMFSVPLIIGAVRAYNGDLEKFAKGLEADRAKREGEEYDAAAAKDFSLRVGLINDYGAASAEMLTPDHVFSDEELDFIFNKLAPAEENLAAGSPKKGAAAALKGLVFEKLMPDSKEKLQFRVNEWCTKCSLEFSRILNREPDENSLKTAEERMRLMDSSLDTLVTKLSDHLSEVIDDHKAEFKRFADLAYARARAKFINPDAVEIKPEEDAFINGYATASFAEDFFDNLAGPMIKGMVTDRLRITGCPDNIRNMINADLGKIMSSDDVLTHPCFKSLRQKLTELTKCKFEDEEKILSAREEERQQRYSENHLPSPDEFGKELEKFCGEAYESLDRMQKYHADPLISNTGLFTAKLAVAGRIYAMRATGHWPEDKTLSPAMLTEEAQKLVESEDFKAVIKGRTELAAEITASRNNAANSMLCPAVSKILVEIDKKKFTRAADNIKEELSHIREGRKRSASFSKKSDARETEIDPLSRI